MRLRTLLNALLLVATAPALAAEEPPALAEAVAEGRLPPLAERLPAEPRRDVPERADWHVGRYGGTLTNLIRGGRDPRVLSRLGYARLVVWDEDRALRPDILAGWDVSEGGRSFTLRLRPGHRWSDGHPFTSEDFRFWWEEIATDTRLSPAGPPAALLADGAPPHVEVPDPLTVRYTWPAPNPRFLPALAATDPPFIYRPAHYLRAFLGDSTSEEHDTNNWIETFLAKDRPFLSDNLDRPTLGPWVNTSRPPAERWVAVRNPYFHRVDPEGRQFPYIDRVILIPTQPRLIPAKTAAGESDLQAIGLAFGDFTLLKSAEPRAGIATSMWTVARGAQLALYLNFNVQDAEFRKLFRDARFRRALSLAIDRTELNDLLYQGRAIPGADTVLPGSPLYREALRAAPFDPAAAEALLDELGLVREPRSTLRRLPDGRPLSLIVETGFADPTEVDLLSLIGDTWKAVGVGLDIRSTNRGALRQRLTAGVTQVSTFYGLANGLAGPDDDPAELVPSSGRQPQWPLWGLWAETGGRGGEAPDLPAVERLLELYGAWQGAVDETGRRAAWEALLALHAEEVFAIGTLGGVPQPVVRSARLRNVPEEAVYHYQPGAYFGAYRVDTFFYEPDD